MSLVMLSFHGGSFATSINNVGVFTLDADDSLTPAIPFYALQPEQKTDFGALPALRELRGLALHPSDGTLLVANAYKEFSQVLQFAPTSQPGVFEFSAIYAANQVNHPFDLVFAFNDYLYVSNQDAMKGDTPAITYYTGPDAPGETFATAEVFKDLRGLAFDGKYLYVADAGTGTFYAFTADGGAPTQTFKLGEPVHLLYDGTRYVYIGDESKNCVYLYDTTTQDAPTPLIQGDTGLDRTAGLALIPVDSSSATLVAASRKGNSILAYPITLGTPPTWDGTSKPLLSGLTDLPEFILLVS